MTAVLFDTLAAEWLKLRSIRSSYGLIGAMFVVVALTGLLCLYIEQLWRTLPAPQRDRLTVTPPELMVEQVAQACLAILGVLTVSSEHTTGSIRTTLTAVPARRTLLLAKALLVTAVAAVTGLLALVGAYLIRTALLGGHPIHGLTQAPAAGHPARLLAMATGVTMFAVLGVGLGSLTRSGVAGIGALVALWYPVPIIVFHLPAPWSQRFGSVLPGALPAELVAPEAGLGSVFGTGLPPWAALVAMLAYAGLPLGAALLLTTRRDGS